MYDLQILFEKIGPMGLSQFLYFIYLAYGKVWTIYMNISPVFTSYIPDYRCSVPPLDDKHAYPNLTELDILNYTTKYDTGQQKHDGCSRYGYNFSTCVNGSLSCVDISSPTIPCDRGYVFDTSVMKTTAVTKYGLICDQIFMNSFSTSIYFVGMLIASIIFGNMADNIGRMRAISLAQVMFISAVLANTFFTQTLTMYIITRFIMAVGSFGTEVSLTVYANELTTPKTRTFFMGLVNFGCVFAVLFLSGAAYNWRTHSAVTLFGAVATIPFFILSLILSESPRWLLRKNKIDQAKKAIEIMGKVNKVKLTEEDFNQAKIPSGNNEEEQETASSTRRRRTFIDLFKSREMSKVVALLTLNWFSCTFGYYGIALNAGSLSGNIFVNNMLYAIMEAAGYIFITFTLDRFGRRNVLAYSHLLAGFALVASTAIILIYPGNKDLQIFTKIFGLLAKFGISVAFGVTFQYTNELFPTELRSNGFGWSSTIGRLGSIFAPFVIDMQQSYKWLPSTIFGSGEIIAGLATFLLPETMGIKLLESEEDAIQFYKNWRSTGNKTCEDKK